MTPGGLLLVISSPSGAGKTTLSRRLVRENPELRFSVSYTTRPPRAGETDGVDYHFVSESSFDALIAADAFAEWAVVHGRRYGTSIQAVRAALDGGAQVLFDVDYQGAERLLSQFPREARLVFILPPTMAVLEQRLRGRATDAAEVIERRLRKAREELQHYRSYQYLVLNDDVERGYAELSAIYEVERAHARFTAAPELAEALARRCASARRAAHVEALLAEPVGVAADGPGLAGV